MIGPGSTGGPTGFHAGAIGIGEIGVARDGGTLRTFVGSCVGLAMYDRQRRIAGLAHIMLPEAPGAGLPAGKYADTAIPAMIRLLEQIGAGRPVHLSAKMVGGAAMFAFQSGRTIGDQNVGAIERILERLGIPVVARDCGGDRGRRVSVDVPTGTLTVETLGLPPTTL